MTTKVDHPQDQTDPQTYLLAAIKSLEAKVDGLSPKRNRQDEGSGNPAVGAVVKMYRTKGKLSLTQLAEKTGLNRAFLGRIEQGKRGMSLHTYLTLCEALNYHINGWGFHAYVSTITLHPGDPFNPTAHEEFLYRGAGQSDGLAGEQAVQA